MLVSRYSLLENIVSISRKILKFSIPLFLLYYIQNVFDGLSISYWGGGGVPFVLFLIFVCLGISDFLTSIKRNPCKSILSDIGKKSYCIYLIHFPLVGLINIAFTNINLAFLQLIQPVVTLLATYLFIYNFYTFIIHLIYQENFTYYWD